LPHFAVPFAQTSNRKFCCSLLSKVLYLRRAWRWFNKNRNMLPWYINKHNIIPVRTAVAQWLRCCATIRKVAGSIPAGVTGTFHWHKVLPIALWPWGRIRLQQKWVPRSFHGGKGGLYVRLPNLPSTCAFVMKSGNLNFLQPSRPLHACNGPDFDSPPYAVAVMEV